MIFWYPEQHVRPKGVSVFKFGRRLQLYPGPVLFWKKLKDFDSNFQVFLEMEVGVKLYTALERVAMA